MRVANSNKIDKLVNRAVEQAEKSVMYDQHGAILFKNGGKRIVNSGFNHYHYETSMHAEIDSLFVGRGRTTYLGLQEYQSKVARREEKNKI